MLTSVGDNWNHVMSVNLLNTKGIITKKQVEKGSIPPVT